MHLYHLLIDPISRKKLEIDTSTNVIIGLDSSLFWSKIEGKIPVILPSNVDDNLKTSEHHQLVKSTFNYIAHYQKDADTFDYFRTLEDPISQDESNRLGQKIMDHIPAAADVILDVGCGGGWLSKRFQNDHNHVISMDISLKNPRKALENQPHPNHSALVADVFHLPIMDNSIDCIVASEIMEHVSDPRLFIEKLFEALKPGGKLIITTPYNEVIPKHLCIHCNNLTPENAHLHSFNEDNIKELIPPTSTSWRYETFANKYFAKLRIYLLMRKWPFGIWKLVDKTANRIFNKPLRLMIEIVK